MCVCVYRGRREGEEEGERAREMLHTSREDALAHVEDMFQSPGLADIRKTQFFFCLQKFAKLSALVLVCPSIGVP